MMKTSSKTISALALTSMMGAAGCAPGDTLGESVDAINLGTPVTVGSREARSTVSVNNGSCTGTIIGRRYVLTAAHCQPQVGAVVTFYTGSTPSSVTRTAARVAFRPGVNPWYFPPNSSHADLDDDDGHFADLAVLELSGDIPDGYGPAELPTQTMANNTTGTLVGVGGHNNASNPTVRMDQVNATVNTLLTDYWQLYSSTPNGLPINPGDSGGPFYTTNPATGGLVLRGVLYGTWITNAVHTPVYEHLGWILQQTRQSTYLADVNGDGRADGVAVNGADTWVALHDGTRFLPPQRWLGVPFYGTRGTFFADVDGDGRADAVAVNDTSVWVARSTYRWDLSRPQPRRVDSFAAPTLWRSGAFYGQRVTLVGDVDRDRRADIVAVSDDHTDVSLSTGASFGAATRWSAQPFYGSRRTDLGDMDADGDLDLVAINGGDVWVMRSTGAGFSAAEPWNSGALPTGPWTAYLADIDGDRRADITGLVNHDLVVYRNSADVTGFTLSYHEVASPVGLPQFTSPSRGATFGDLDGDGDAEVVSWSDASVQWVHVTTGSSLSVQAQSGYAFYGSIER